MYGIWIRTRFASPPEAGRSGKFVIRATLARGVDVTAVVRTPDKAPDLQNARLQIVISDPAFLVSVFPGHDSVISTLGGRLPTRAAAPFLVRSANAIVEAASATCLKRVLTTSTA
ncbi:NAD(P)H-binding protein [Ruegeria atlantica]|uniref:NAD(P)H-binding protein n=1 Tax=Ruegeria atlantica TaxID=81569 RepID=UPI00349FD3AB